MKKWRQCLERAKLVKQRVQAYGQDVAKHGSHVVAKHASLSSTTPRQDSSQGGNTGISGAATGQAGLGQLSGPQVAVLRQSCRVNQSVLPLWQDTLSPDWPRTIEAECLSGEPSRRYGRLPSLSAEQSAYDPTWVPLQQDQARISSSPTLEARKANVDRLRVEQGIGANCSVVVGLESCLRHNLATGHALIQENIQPLRWSKRPHADSSGQDGVSWSKMKLFVNGAWRAVSCSHAPALVTFCDHWLTLCLAAPSWSLTIPFPRLIDQNPSYMLLW